MELANTKPVQLPFNGIRQHRRCRRHPPGGSDGETSEAGKVERDDLVVFAQRVVNRPPADHRLSYPMEQDQRLAPSRPIMGELAGSGRRQAGSDDVSLARWTAREHHPSFNSHRHPHLPRMAWGGPSLER